MTTYYFPQDSLDFKPGSMQYKVLVDASDTFDELFEVVMNEDFSMKLEEKLALGQLATLLGDSYIFEPPRFIPRMHPLTAQAVDIALGYYFNGLDRRETESLEGQILSADLLTTFPPGFPDTTHDVAKGAAIVGMHLSSFAKFGRPDSFQELFMFVKNLHDQVNHLYTVSRNDP